jgi:hypothetical protein
VTTIVINEDSNSRKLNGENYLTSPCVIKEEVVSYTVINGASYCEQTCEKSVKLITATCNMGGSGSYFAEGGTTGEYAAGYYSYSGGGGGSNWGSIPPPSTIYLEEAIWNTLNQINLNTEYFIPCAQLKEKLTSLINFRPSATVKNRLTNLSNSGLFSNEINSWRIQDLNNAQGHLINLDYFSVKIDKLPNGFSTPEQFLEYIRLNINNFILEHTEDPDFFQPHPTLGAAEVQNWVSGNEGALVSINIFPDPGTVVLSKKELHRWVLLQ